jgi:hypothetical protein
MDAAGGDDHPRRTCGGGYVGEYVCVVVHHDESVYKDNSTYLPER